MYFLYLWNMCAVHLHCIIHQGLPSHQKWEKPVPLLLHYRWERRGECLYGVEATDTSTWVFWPCLTRRWRNWSPSGHEGGHQNFRWPIHWWTFLPTPGQQNNVSTVVNISMTFLVEQLAHSVQFWGQFQLSDMEFVIPFLCELFSGTYWFSTTVPKKRLVSQALNWPLSDGVMMRWGCVPASHLLAITRWEAGVYTLWCGCCLL